MTVAEGIGRRLAVLGADHVFGVVGSGNFHVTNALIAAGARFVAAAHEGGAATMADAYARVSGRVGVLSVHQGPGVTNALTGIAEAAKSRTPLVVLAPEAPNPRSNFHLDLAGLAAAVGAGFRRVCREHALDDVDAARAALTRLADRCGALLAVSAAAKGLFAGDPWYVDVSGGFATPLAASLIAEADLVVAWGSTLNMWTTRHGRLIPAGATVVQVDHDPGALGINRKIDLGVVGDVVAVAEAVTADLGDWSAVGWRSAQVRARIADEGQWRNVPYVDSSTREGIDPRTLTIALDDLLPAERTVAVDSGNFMGYPAMFLSVPDAAGFCFTQAFQSVGLGLATAIGAAVARTDRLTVAALGDGGFLMSVAELATAVRLGLPMVIVVYDDAAYGAEVHHFGPDGHPLDTVTFPDTDLAAIGRGFGCDALTVRSPADLAGVRDWLDGPRSAPLLIDAKVRSPRGAWWLEEAFRGH